MQWNVWYKEDIENIVKLLREISPDIICLQELTRNYDQQSHKDTLKYISDSLGYNYYGGNPNPASHTSLERTLSNGVNYLGLKSEASLLRHAWVVPLILDV